MPTSWPRNIVPYTEEKLRALSTVESVALYDAALDRPLVESELTDAQRAIADALLDAGLLKRQGAELVPTNRHRRDPEGDVPGVVEHKLAVNGYMRSILDETDAALTERGHKAQAAAGFIRLPETPENVARAIAIIAEAEDQLRALQEEEKFEPGGREMRVIVYLGSTK